MVQFPNGKCPQCGRNATLMVSNNPLSGTPICFECINKHLDYNNLEHAEFFCRTYNLPWKPDLWLSLANEKEHIWQQYTELMLDAAENQPNLAYTSTTHDLWARTNKEWEKCRSFNQILLQLIPIKESYITRARLKWGEQYTFEELIKLDSIYTRTLKANNITNPLQKEAVKTLCKLHIGMDEAIRANDAKAMKDFAATYSAFAKQADLESMINETRTDDITTVSELYQYMEDQGFVFKFHDGFDRDEVDRTIKDIQSYLRTLVLESTGLQPLLEDMARKRMETEEEDHAAAATAETPLQDLLNFSPEDAEIDREADDDVLNETFEDDSKGGISVIFKDDLNPGGED